MFSKFKKNILDLKNSIFFEKNETIFHETFPKYIKKEKSNKKEKIYFFLAQDYYHLCHISYLSNLTKLSKYEFVGIWGLDLNSQWKTENKVLEFFLLLKRKLLSFFVKKKWIKLYRSIGIYEIIDVSKISRNKKKNFQQDAKKIINKINRNKIVNTKLENIQIGDLLIDTYIRYRNVPYIDFNDKFLKQVLINFLIFRHNTKSLIKNNSIKKYITYFANLSHGVTCRTFLNSNIDVYSTGDPISYLKKLTQDSPNSITNYKKFKKKFKVVLNKKNKIKLARKEFVKRFEGKIDKSFRYMRVSPYKNYNSKMKFKTKGVLFLHDFIDSPHHYGSMIFNSFWEWAVYSLETIEKFNLDIAIKPHPNSYYQTRRFNEQLEKRFNKLKWIHHKTSNKDIFKSGIKFGVSVYGSVLLELAYHNIIPIASTRYHPYTNYNFVYTPKNLSQYKNFLINSNKLKTNIFSKRNIEEFYYMQSFYNHDSLKNTGRLLNLKEEKNIGSIGLINYLGKIKKIV